jgi:DNA-binding beta-propeller fold protein YncE
LRQGEQECNSEVDRDPRRSAYPPRTDREGTVTTIAGAGKNGGGDGGPAREAELSSPHSLAVAANGEIYIADNGNNRVRKVDARTGTISTVAGTGERGHTGDGGTAIKARFGNIYCVALGPRGERSTVAPMAQLTSGTGPRVMAGPSCAASCAEAGTGFAKTASPRERLRRYCSPSDVASSNRWFQ